MTKKDIENFNRIFGGVWVSDPRIVKLETEFLKHQKKRDQLFESKQFNAYHEERRTFKQWLDLNGYTNEDVNRLKRSGLKY